MRASSIETSTFRIWFCVFGFSVSYLFIFVVGTIYFGWNGAGCTHQFKAKPGAGVVVGFNHSFSLSLPLGLTFTNHSAVEEKKTIIIIIIINSQRSFSSFFRFNFYLSRFRAFHFGFFVISVYSVLRRFCRFSLCNMNRSGWYISHSTAFDAVVDIALFVQ